jgi:hypothetical protein
MPPQKRFWVPALRRTATRCAASGTREKKAPSGGGTTGRGLMSDYAMRVSLI